ncbi:MAG TPA: NAD(P)H-dependent oxidoreductase [Burkholderiales bacterium]
MGKRIALIQGHPDPAAGHFGHALADAYERSASAAGHQVRIIEVARLGLPLVRNAKEWESAPLARPVEAAQRDIAWAEHLAIFFPLWLGDMPALLKGFFEQVLRPGFAIGKPGRAGVPKKLLKGRSARIVVTMGMPALFYSVYYRAHSVKSLKRNMLEFCGVAPVRTTLIGMVERGKEAREDWLLRLAVLGNAAS